MNIEHFLERFVSIGIPDKTGRPEDFAIRLRLIKVLAVVAVILCLFLWLFQMDRIHKQLVAEVLALQATSQCSYEINKVVIVCVDADLWAKSSAVVQRGWVVGHLQIAKPPVVTFVVLSNDKKTVLNRIPLTAPRTPPPAMRP